jgi:hypothetical protein
MIRKLSLPPISNSEDRDGPSCVRVPARGLSPLRSGAAVASYLAPSSGFPFTRWGQAQHAPPSAQAPLPRRLPRLSSRLPCLVGRRASACSCRPLARDQKPSGSAPSGSTPTASPVPISSVRTVGSPMLKCTRWLAMASMVGLSRSRRFGVRPAARRSVLDATLRSIV